MTYAINGKEYSEVDINKRCAEIMGLKVSKEQYLHFGDRDENVVLIGRARDSYAVDYCHVWNDAGPIIEKIWDELTSRPDRDFPTTLWEELIEDYQCTQLVAACICFIEINESKQ